MNDMFGEFETWSTSDGNSIHAWDHVQLKTRVNIANHSLKIYNVKLFIWLMVKVNGIQGTNNGDYSVSSSQSFLQIS